MPVLTTVEIEALREKVKELGNEIRKLKEEKADPNLVRQFCFYGI